MQNFHDRDFFLNLSSSRLLSLLPKPVCTAPLNGCHKREIVPKIFDKRWLDEYYQYQRMLGPY